LIDLPGLNSFDAIATDPAVSENGRYIVFSRQGRLGIFIDRELRSLRNLTGNLQAEVRNPTISADGSTIAFESSANGQWDILYTTAQPLNVPCPRWGQGTRDKGTGRDCEGSSLSCHPSPLPCPPLVTSLLDGSISDRTS